MKAILTLLLFLLFTATAQAPDDQMNDQGFNMMSFFDEDKDGKISSSQFISYVSNIEELKAEFGEDDWHENALYAFHVVDLDEDGFLNEDEFDIFVEELYGFDEENISYGGQDETEDMEQDQTEDMEEDF